MAEPKTKSAPKPSAVAAAAALFSEPTPPVENQVVIPPVQKAPDQPALRLDGPTVDEYVKAGYKAETYPPAGYAPRVRKFYHAMNSNQFIESNGLMFSFSPYQHLCGTWFGTYATDKANEVAALDKVVDAQKIHGIHARVTELTQEEHQACLKKKAGTLQSLGQSLIHSEVSSESLPSVSHAVPLNTEPQPPAAPLPPVESVDALALGESKMPETAVVAQPAAALPEAPPAE